MTAEIKAVDITGDRHARIRRILGRSVRDALDVHGASLAGFALVSWDMRGEVHSAVMTDVGPVGRSLLPAFAHDALNRHVAVVVAQESSPTEFEGDA